ncbi:YitT family protein [Jeotgalibacillus sp. S-D1]|uniref:YczE/YyaS/YitT family protein n=1 Tax=Jeotgalibacillus sp. S-D1 TaxID=2552189 RepID=UPI0010595420|nr:YitT family protein [Jeotgalibacillus sp. S-D1]TDL33027.1 YitT family protein [Jeotgalibacillus sp. S-D1]
MKRNYGLRWIFFLAGLVILALGITMTIKGQRLGISPWDVLHVGLFQQLGLTVGTWSIIMGSLILLVTCSLTKKLPRIGAILNMLLVGVFIDLFNWLLPEPSSLAGVIFIFVLGVVVMGYGVGIYVSADLGAGPRDTVMMMVVEKTGWGISRVRRGIELVVLAAGFGLGGPVGVGTLITAFFVGSIVHLSLPQSTILLQRLMDRENKNHEQQLASKKAL